MAFIASFKPSHFILILIIIFNNYIIPSSTVRDFSEYFPLHGSVFLPRDRHIDFLKTKKSFGSYKHDMPTKFLATLESVMPVLDIAINDAHHKYLLHWIPNTKNWLDIREVPVFECDDQKRAAWAALEALQWTNGSGVSCSSKLQL